jgi:hypothetical protein
MSDAENVPETEEKPGGELPEGKGPLPSGGAKKKKKHRFAAVLLVALFIIIGIPLICAGLSFIGRIAPGDVIPDSFILYARIPNPVRLADRLLAHETLPEILGNPAFSSALPLLRAVEESGIIKNAAVRFAARGVLEGAVLGENRFLAAWDSGMLAPLLRFLPVLSGAFTIPGLYYVQAGKFSRFEYRLDSGILYIAPYRNLLVVSTDSALFESVLAGTSREGDIRGARRKGIGRENYDAAVLLAPELLTGMLDNQDPVIASALKNIRFTLPVELAFTIEPKQLSVSAAAGALGENDAVRKILERNSTDPSLSGFLPAGVQYATVLAAGSLKDLVEAMQAVFPENVSSTIRRAERSSKSLLGLSLEELLYSWTGEEFAVFGMEGRPAPVYAIQIKDEQKRQEIFNRAFGSVVLAEDISLNLDGTRIPRIRLPDFFAALVKIWGLSIPEPYYTVEGGYLFVSESAETILAAVRGIQKNDSLLKTAVWRSLVRPENGGGAFTVYYSLDRSLPFFLKGNTLVSSVLGLYRQGLLRMGFENGELRFSLTVNPGSGRGIFPAAGFPLDLAGKTGNRVYATVYSQGLSRVFFTRDNFAVAVDPADMTIRELDAGNPLWVIPALGLHPRSPTEASVWVVTTQGRVTLANGDMKALRGFPLATGLRLSAPPASWEGKLFLSDEEGNIHVIDGKGTQNLWGTGFSAALRSPPAFFKTENSAYAALYPKRFLGEIWLLDAEGTALPGWPVPSGGIAFGSPLLFTSENSREKKETLLAAFVTQAGEFSVYNENAEMLPGFPLELPGVFYLQPVWDGEAFWLVSSEGLLCRVTLDGQILSQTIPDLSVKEEGYITTADVDGDKIPEIFFSGEGNALYGYTRNFSSLDGFPLPIWGRPSFQDLNGNGKSECTGMGLDNRLYRWHFR